MRASLTLAALGGRRHLRSLLGATVILALGLGASLGALNVAQRTEDAYPEYLRHAAVAPLTINPSLSTKEGARLLASTPGVTKVTSHSLLTGELVGTRTTPQQAQQNFLQVISSPDGRFTTQDRPAVHRGRMVRSGAEAFASVTTARAYGLRIGDHLRLNLYGIVVGPQGEMTPRLIHQATARLVGIGAFADEALVDRLYPRQRLLVTDDLARAYTCLNDQPKADDPRPLNELFNAVVPPTCSVSYRYYSLQIPGSDAQVHRVGAAIGARFRTANGQLPPSMREAHIGYEVIPTFTSDTTREISRSLAPSITALRAFALIAALATLVVLLLSALRIAERSTAEVAVWRSLGLQRRERALALLLPLLGGAALGVLLALVAGFALTGLGPVGSARAVVASGHPHLELGLTVAAVGLVATVLLLLLAAVGWRAAYGRPRSGPARRGGRVRSARLAGHPTLQLGWRAATRGTSSGAVIGATVVAVMVAMATITFSTSLGGFVSHPDRYGWSYDGAVLVNAGYGPVDLTEVEQILDTPQVASWGAAALAGGLEVNDVTLPFVAGRRGFAAFPSEVVAGSAPTTADEVALGEKTAHQLGVHVGDRVKVTGSNGSVTARISGLVVLPPIGPFGSDRPGLGNGVLLPAPFFDRLVRAGGHSAAEGTSTADNLTGLVVLRLRPGVDPVRFMAATAKAFSRFGPPDSPPFSYAQPVRPSAVDDAASIRSLPALLAGLLVLAMVLGLALGIIGTTRARRTELALFRALGGTTAQSRATVRWNSLAIVGIGIVIGTPLGIAGGRLAYRAFARTLGVSDATAVSPLWISVAVIVVIVVGLLAAAIATRRAGVRPGPRTIEGADRPGERA